MILEILYKLLYWIAIITIILYIIGIRGVSFDSMLSDIEKNKFIIKYTIIIIVALIILIGAKIKMK